MLRVSLPTRAAGLLLAAAFFSPSTPAGAQDVPIAIPAPIPEPAGTGTIATTFSCPGITTVSAGAEVTPLAGAIPSATAQSPADAAENPCIIPGSGPDVDWSAAHSALRMTAPGTWKTKMRTVLADFDALHAQYVANPRIKDVGMWPARLEETLQLTELLAHQSRSDLVVYYAGAFREEYKAGIFDQHPLLMHYALQARAKLDALTAPPPSPTPHSRARR